MKNEKKKYKVSFVIEGYIMDEIAHIGSAEANDVYANKNGTFSLVDCRANYSISATSPEKAYQEAKKLFEEDDFKELHIESWRLEHIYCEYNDKYWYKEDLDI